MKRLREEDQRCQVQLRLRVCAVVDLTQAPQVQILFFLCLILVWEPQLVVLRAHSWVLYAGTT